MGTNRPGGESALDHHMVCIECWDKAYPEGGETITLGVVGTRPCSICGKDVTNKDSYAWMGLSEIEKQLKERYPMNVVKAIEPQDGLRNRIEELEAHNLRQHSEMAGYLEERNEALARVVELEDDAKSPNRHLVAYCNGLQSVRELVDFIALQPCTIHDDQDCLQTSDCITEYCYPCMGRVMKKTFDDVSGGTKEEIICDHYWIKAENEKVTGVAMCIHCYGIAPLGVVNVHSIPPGDIIQQPAPGVNIHMYTKEELEEEQHLKGGSLKPSDYAKVFPCSSKAGKTEIESVAQKIMGVLAVTGNEFRELGIEEFQCVRGNSLYEEEYFFEAAAKHCVSNEAAAGFAAAWRALRRDDD